MAFNKQAEALRSDMNALERSNNDLQSRRDQHDQIEKQMRAW